MNDNIIRFPGAGPPVEEPEAGVDPEATPASPMPTTDGDAFEEWRDEEVPHFLEHAADLDGADPDEFRRVASRLLGQINGWLSVDG